MSRMIPVMVVACFAIACPYTRAAVEVDDFNEHNAAWWGNNGKNYDFPKIDTNGNYQIFTTKCAIAKTALIADHCQNKAGDKLLHLHFQADYDNVEDANRYWDLRFYGAGYVEGWNYSTNAINCYAYVLHNRIENGTYNYWIDMNELSAAFAISADTDGIAKANVAVNDALFYFVPDPETHLPVKDHMTAVNQLSNGKPLVLEFKFNASPVYTFVQWGYDTPMCTGPDPAVGNPVPAWASDLGGAGAESELVANEVRRKK